MQLAPLCLAWNVCFEHKKDLFEDASLSLATMNGGEKVSWLDAMLGRLLPVYGSAFSQYQHTDTEIQLHYHLLTH